MPFFHMKQNLKKKKKFFFYGFRNYFSFTKKALKYKDNISHLYSVNHSDGKTERKI